MANLCPRLSFLLLCVSLFCVTVHCSPGGHHRHGLLDRLAVRHPGPATRSLSGSGNTSIRVRDDYSCSAANPCSNGACCGGSGYCGYGPTYCGDGCVSNCDAHAECGNYSVPAGKECPLNVCQYGFCGTTQDFCDDKCQSNCDLHPEPPSGSATGQVLTRVIGYYEAWSARSNCHQTSPADLPLSALTHINYAFAYIDPVAFQITTMDSATPASLFSELADVKSSYPSLNIFISIGGWTFSDNGTATQAVFGTIASSATNREIFAKKLLSFLDTYGFNGVDLDWEYPGAPDRGGSKEDTKNYVELLKSIREVFTTSGRDLGLTFTAPSSFWYLRWFDLPGMLKYADWVNLMSYDLHGTWDSTNPIGSIVQGHTNLTEIKLSAELLWRVGVQPSQVALGVGFYGRAFTLADPSCTTPGCPFSGGANPGVCTATSGYLAYYEVMDILSKDSSIKVIHDKDAAVKYFSWDSNQWISYDDGDTFKQKVDWANDVGFGGALIWASDLDDYNWTAHAGLLGKPIVDDSTLHLSKAGVSSMYDNQFLAQCYRFPECVDMDNPQASSCGAGEVWVGYDSAGCSCLGTSCGQPICCPKDSAPKSCSWRGSGGDCNGQCHEGEITLLHSGWGGFPTESNMDRCNRGDKVFCCEPEVYQDMTSECRWTDGCGNGCNDDEESVAWMYDRWGYCSVFSHGNDYCCKKSQPRPFLDCHWVGQGDCADNTCGSSEITLLTDGRGDSYFGCSWWRHKALCCTPNLNAITTSMCGGFDPCSYDESFCLDEYGDPLVPNDQDDGNDAGSGNSKLKARGLAMDLTAAIGGYDESLEVHALEERVLKEHVIAAGKSLKYAFYSWEPSSRLFNGQAGKFVVQAGFRMLGDKCANTAVEALLPSDIKVGNLFEGFQTEHSFEKQVIKKFWDTAVSGVLASGAKTKASPISVDALINLWMKDIPGASSLPLIGTSKVLRTTPNDRVFEAVGSTANRIGQFLVHQDLNRVKGNLFSLVDPISEKMWKKIKSDLVAGVSSAEHSVLETFATVPGAFNYFNHDLVAPQALLARTLVRDQWQIINDHVPELSGIYPLWKEFLPDYHGVVSATAKTWLVDNMAMLTAFLGNNNVPGDMVLRILAQMADIKGKLGDIVIKDSTS